MTETAGQRMTLKTVLTAVRDPLIYKNFAIHLFVLLPATLVLTYFAVRLDRHFGWSAIAPPALRLMIAAPLLALGTLIVVYSYAYLLVRGQGSPGSHLGGPTRLVTTGPYALVRHPSVIGKLFGVIAVGLIVGSPTFLLGFVPFLLAYSLVTNRFIQERYCERAFGRAYRRYRARVPMILPHPRQMWAAMRGRATPIDAGDFAPAPQAIPRYELAIYLVFLALIMLGAWRLVVWVTAG